MKDILKYFDKAFENRVRLGIMSSLVVNEDLNFKDLKRLLGVTDGNLASHLKSLEKLRYISYEKSFIDRKPNTSYRATSLGREAFKNHILALEKFLKL